MASASSGSDNFYGQPGMSNWEQKIVEFRLYRDSTISNIFRFFQRVQKPFVNTLLCALDRIIDEAAIQTAGRELPQEKAGYSFYTTGKVKAVELLADRQK